MSKPKILIIRFSSIGDIILVSPVLRCVKKQLNAEIHFLTKKSFYELSKHNPNIDKLILFDKKNESLNHLVKRLKTENYNSIIDLHNNLRSNYVCKRLGIKSIKYNKLNKEKFLLTKFKKDMLPEKHLVDRYFEALNAIKVKNDGLGLDFFIPIMEHVQLSKFDIKLKPANYYVIAVGTNYYTKSIPTDIIIELSNKQPDKQFVLIGGKGDIEKGNLIEVATSNCINLSGKLSINESASVINQCKKIITPDTGMMHIAAALGKPILSIWGSTFPRFGMYPYPKNEKHEIHIFEVSDLNCRPCSKLGYQKCPKRHFNCMNMINLQDIVNALNL